MRGRHDLFIFIFLPIGLLMTRLPTILILGLLIVAPSALFAIELEDREWIEVRTANFQIRSMLSEKESLNLARYLEMFRVVASIVTNTGLIDSPVPTEIFAIRGRGASRDFNLDSNTAGLFRAGVRKNTIIVRNTVGMDEAAIVMHEYVHFLVRNHGSSNYPMWFNEGFAEYLSSAVIDSEIVTIGNVPEGRLNSFKFSDWIHMRLIISRTGGDDWRPERSAMFYAEAWGLVHYLQNRSDIDTPFGQQLQRYVTLLDTGTEAVEAFETAFAISIEDLDRNVSRYLGRNRIPGIQFELDAVVTDFETQVKEISKTEISLALGQYALMNGNLDKAETWFALAANDERFEAQAEAGLGDVQKFQGNFDEALPHFERAISLAPDDPYCQLDVAEFWHDRAENPDDKANQTIYLTNARKHYLDAWRLDDSMPETYAQYGKSFMIEGEDYRKAVGMLEQAQQRLPSSLQIRLDLARAYLGAERFDDAATAARSVLSWSHSESEAAKIAQEILDSSVAEN